MFERLQIESHIEMAICCSILKRCLITYISDVGRTFQLLNKKVNYLQVAMICCIVEGSVVVGSLLVWIAMLF